MFIKEEIQMSKKNAIKKSILILNSIALSVFMVISIMSFLEIFGNLSFFDYYEAAPHILIPATNIVLILGLLYFLKFLKGNDDVKERDFYLLGGFSLAAFLMIIALLILLVYYGSVTALGYVLLILLLLNLMSVGAVIVLIILLHNSPENEFQSDEKNDKKSVDKFKYAAEKLKELQLLKSENIIDEETYEKLKNKYIKML